jgi:phenylalanyl-tRNA synthetase beta chain
MQISLKWVNEIINIQNINLDYLIEKLTLAGFEVEEIIEVEENGKKIITLEISSTANRSDSLSINGISREMSTILDKPYKFSKYLEQTSNWEDKFSNYFVSSIKQTETSIFLAVTVENLTHTNPPIWLTNKLKTCGIIPQNNLLDYKSFILLETGYPMEFYDLYQIQSKVNSMEFDLTLTNKIKNQKFIGSNNIEYNLTNSSLLLKANNEVISIAGLIPEMQFTSTNETKTLLIEAAVFNSSFIRKQSRNLGLRTDRSARYEKSIKNTELFNALYRLLRLLKISNPNLICKLTTFSEILEEKPKIIKLSYNLINEILGPIKGSDNTAVNYISPILIGKYLNRLKFSYQFKKSDLSWDVKIPYFRSEDINRPIDLIEEIGRLHGFNQFLTRLPKIQRIGLEDPSYKTRKKLSSYFLNLGFNELIHYSLVGNQDLPQMPLKLINPLLMDSSNLRTSLLPSLIKTIKENLNQGNSYFDGFEYGHTYFYDTKKGFYEKEIISGIFGGNKIKNNWSESGNSLNWFRAKGKIDGILKQLKIVTRWKLSSDPNYTNLLHPYRSAELYLPDEKRIGLFGQINPILAAKLNISSELHLFEFDFDLIKNVLQTNKITIYKEYSLYPKIVKDLSFVIHRNIAFSEIRRVLLKNGTRFLNDIKFLDEYRSESLMPDHISLCLQLIFQSQEKTLENKLIENIVKNLEFVLTSHFNAELRC